MLKSLFERMAEAMRGPDPMLVVDQLESVIPHDERRRIAVLAAKAAICGGQPDLDQSLAHLAQAFMKGRLGPHELRGIAEFSVGVVLVITDGLHLTAHELVKEVGAGAVTAPVLARAILSQGRRIDRVARSVRGPDRILLERLGD